MSYGIPNEDRLKEQYYPLPECDDEPDTCAVCGEEEYGMVDSPRLGTLCSDCTRKCSLCDDWLLGDPTVVKDSEGNEAHKVCAEELAYEQQHSTDDSEPE